MQTATDAKMRISDGSTEGERVLIQTLRKSFLKLWTLGNPFKKPQEELADALVLAENHVVIFSERSRPCPANSELPRTWPRWKNKVIGGGGAQLRMAHNWLSRNDNRFFMDSACTTRCPIQIPRPAECIYHLVLVASDINQGCKDFFGDPTGTLLLGNTEFDPEHFEPYVVSTKDFPERFIHIFDIEGLRHVLAEVDTITDFLKYLDERRRFFESQTRLRVAGEEELIAVFQMNTKNGEHFIPLPEGYNSVYFDVGYHAEYVETGFKARRDRGNVSSYRWDELIEHLTEDIFTGKVPLDRVASGEIALRQLALESRLARRSHVHALDELSSQSVIGEWRTKITRAHANQSRAFVYVLFLEDPENKGSMDATFMPELTKVYGLAALHRFPELDSVVVLGFHSHPFVGQNIGLYHLLRHEMIEEGLEMQAKELVEKHGFLRELKFREFSTTEFPKSEATVDVRPRKFGRNEKCWCGSGKKYKHCCMRRAGS
jgi:hypothetical protein